VSVVAKRGTPSSRKTRNKKRAPAPQVSASTQTLPAPGPASEQGVAVHEPDAGTLIVGVGGSAGSLSPLRELLAAIPADSGMAFIVVSHQAPTGHSMLPEILAKCTEMPVCEIGKDTRVEPNHVYVEPRGHGVTIREGTLSLDPTTLREVPHLPIDLFFRALASDQEIRAVGIVLSGTGTDGTLGLAAIRAASGLALVQDPATAEFDGMPTSAIQARAADFVVSPAEMPARLLIQRKGLASLERMGAATEIADTQIKRILTIIRKIGGYDFSEYKHGTLVRRIVRRMQLHGVEDLEEYAHLLEESDVEIAALWHDWLIGVSSFFRDSEAFQALESALEKLIAERRDGSPLRIWIPGCATGEEVYSIVIVLLETLRRLDKHLETKVFATDLNPSAIQIARAGRYPMGIAANVSEQRLARFFNREDGHYRVRRELRDLVVFAIQDALHDPPFTRVDLVSCRNILIYLEPSGQRRLLRAFHYGLNPRGLLLLGSAETASGSEAYFSLIEGHHKLYRRNDSTAAQLTIGWPGAHSKHRNAPARINSVSSKTDLASPLRMALAERFGPPAVLVDTEGRIQQIHGNVEAYLGLQPGRSSLNIVDMARDALRAPLASALRESIETEGRVAKRSVRLQVDRVRLAVHLEVSRLHGPRLAAPLFVVSFEPVERSARKRNGEPLAEGAEVRRGADMDLEQELQDTRHDLQGSIDELQAANEELAATNEEVQSANEELQSTNEELQTAKEETQSLNEELHTVNAELARKLETFEEATDDLVNLMNNIEVATIFLDSKLRVKRFTPKARRVARLIDADIGRPMADMVTEIDYPGLLSDAASVIATLQASETQAAAPDGSWYRVRIQPYRTSRGVVEGVVITFIDITEVKRNERLQAARALAECIVDAVREPLLVLDNGLRVVRANDAYYRVFRTGPQETTGQLLGDLENHQWVISTLRERLEKTLQEGEGFDDFEVEFELPHSGRRRLLLSARPLQFAAGTAAELVLLGFQELGGPQLGTPESDGGER
jgi:two-component system, chemotaxis family, CheB/CheR fusion protein